MTYFQSLFLDNPVLDYFHRAAWRRWRRWGWIVALFPLVIVGWHLFFEYLSIVRGYRNNGPGPAVFSTLAGGLCIAFLAAGACVFSLAGVARLLHPDRVEPLFLTSLDPAQIWVAALVNLNRNLLILLTATVPLLLADGALANLSPWMILREAAWLLLFCNVWFLIFAVAGLQVGLRFVSFRSGFLLALYVAFGAGGLMETWYGERNLNVLFLFGPHPLPSVVRDWTLLDPGGFMSASATRLTILGWPFPYVPAVLVALACLASGLIGRLLVGPMRLPSPPTERGASGESQTRPRTLGESFAKWAENPIPWLASAKPAYTWVQIWERMYENIHPALRRRMYLAKAAASGVLWTLFAVAIFDFLSFTSGRPGLRYGTDDLLAFLTILQTLGLFAGFHFAYAGANPEAMARGPSRSAREAAYAFKIGVLLLCAWIAGASIGGEKYYRLGAHFEGPQWDWPIDISFHRYLLFIVLALGSQSVFQLWVSSKSRQATQAVFFCAL
ncbi:MAG: hypothetical protein NTW86_00090, partial [Candidatus Sumerlaeota bacterium]|nr:hypothetical protein [Candidatus Sumerlaeota bacterium]